MKFLCLSLSSLASTLVTIPQPGGPYGVSLTNIQLNDTKRTDPYTGEPFRLLPLTVISPTGPSSDCRPNLQPYMPNATAHYWENALGQTYGLPLKDTFSQVELSLCEPRKTKDQYPLIFFSPGLAAPRQFYTILTTNLAAQGYVVIQVGIPGEIPFIQFPDGQIEYSNATMTSPQEHAAAIDVRVKDISFVLDVFSSSSGCDALYPMISNVNTTSPSIFGHSFGGATAMSTLVADDRFVAGANIDGAFCGTGLSESTDRPFMILASTPNDTARDLSNVPNWAETWPHLQGPKWLVSVKNTTHNSFVDSGLIAEYFGLLKIPAVREVLGEIDPKELLKIQVPLLSEMAKLANGMADAQNVSDTAEMFRQVEILNSTLPNGR